MDFLKPKQNEVRLGDNDLETIANGGSIKKWLPNGDEIIISQNIAQDVVQPLVEHDRKLLSKAEVRNMKLGARMGNGLFNPIA